MPVLIMNALKVFESGGLRHCAKIQFAQPPSTAKLCRYRLAYYFLSRFVRTIEVMTDGTLKLFEALSSKPKTLQASGIYPSSSILSIPAAISLPLGDLPLGDPTGTPADATRTRRSSST